MTKEKKKFFTRDIRIGGVLKRSPRFLLKRDADQWYEMKKHERDATFRTYQVKIDDKTILNDFFFANWYPKRKEKYPKATTDSDLQRYRDYVKPKLGHLVVSKINTLQIRKCLADVVDSHKKSIQTRNRVRALLSKMFSDAMNDSGGPLRDSNPALHITFNDPRTGKYEPGFISKEKDAVKYLKAAKELGPNHYAIAAIGLMAGLRKSEIIPLKWGDVDTEESFIDVNKKLEQASMTIKAGTKSGSQETRQVPVPDDLILILKDKRKKSDFQGDDDFILHHEDGSMISPSQFGNMAEDIAKASGVDVTPHELRHTYGREFAKRSGNMKALQSILGHSSSAVTDLYSKLAGKHVSKLRNTVTFKEKPEGKDDEK